MPKPDEGNQAESLAALERIRATLEATGDVKRSEVSPAAAPADVRRRQRRSD